MRISWNRTAVLTAITAIALVGAACSSEPEATATPANITPVSFPYIFSGTFTVSGAPGPQGIPMFARLGEGRGPFNEAIRDGEYINVSIAPADSEDIGGEITFFIGHPDGPTVQAEETWVFAATSQPQFIELDLTFAELP